MIDKFAHPSNIENICCHKCWTARNFPGSQKIEKCFTFMIVCPNCGNKRCPKATYHENKCTNSNDVMQPGSIYGGL